MQTALARSAPRSRPMSAPRIRRCPVAELPRVMELFRTAYPGNPRLQERDYVEWQYLRSPWHEGPDAALLLLEEGPDIRAVMGYTPVRFRHGAAIGSGCTTLTWHAFGPGTSGLAVLARLAELFENRFYIGLSDDSVPIYRAYRVPMLSPMPRWLGILDADAVRARFGVEDEPGLRESAARLAQVSAGATPGVEVVRRFADDVEYRPPRDAVDSGILRTGRYLNWRYVDIPRHGYQAIQGADGQMAVWRVESFTGCTDGAVRILEWTFGAALGAPALAHLLDDARRRGAILADFFCTSPVVGASLEALGFVPEAALRAPVPHLFRPIHHAPGLRLAIDLPPHRRPRELDFARWYVTKGDSDLDRVKR